MTDLQFFFFCFQFNRNKYPVLPNVKHLHLALDIDECSAHGGLGNLRFIIDAFPNLEKLVLHVGILMFSCGDESLLFCLINFY